VAYTAGFSVNVGDPTKASNITTLAANDDYLKAITDALFPSTGNLTNYVASNGSDPTISLGTSSTNRLLITSDIASGSQELDAVNFSTVTAASGADKGKFVFLVDEVTIATIDDDGIDLAASKAFTVNGSSIAATPAGSDHQVQWNDSGSFGASANLTFDGSTLTLSGDQNNYEDSNDANNSLSLGSGANERLEIKSINASGTKTLEELRFTTKTASGTGDHGKMTFYVDDVERFKILDAGIQFGTGGAFTVDTDLLTITGSSNPPLTINTTNTKKLLLKDVDDSSLIFAEGSTERATITWSASGDSLTIYNEEESRGVRINTDFEYYNGSSWSSLTSGGGGISWDGSTANGVATYKDADEATVEAELTFDNEVLAIGTRHSYHADMQAYSTDMSSLFYGNDTGYKPSWVLHNMYWPDAAQTSGANDQFKLIQDATSVGFGAIRFQSGSCAIFGGTISSSSAGDDIGSLGSKEHCTFGADHSFAMYNSGTAIKVGGGSWGSSSDSRVKRDIEDYTAGLSDIIKLRPRSYYLNGKGGISPLGDDMVNDQKYYGIVAQEVVAENVFDECLSTRKAKLNDDDTGETDLYVWDPSALTYAMVNAFKEINQELIAVKARLATLEAE